MAPTAMWREPCQSILVAPTCPQGSVLPRSCAGRRHNTWCRAVGGGSVISGADAGEAALGVTTGRIGGAALWGWEDSQATQAGTCVQLW